MKTFLRYSVRIAMIFLAGFMLACKSDRPQPFLRPSKMVDLVCDIRLAEAHLYQTRERNSQEANRIMLDRAIDVYVPVFQKYGINYKQFQALESYYMKRPDKMEKIMRKAAQKLTEMKDEAVRRQEDGQASDSTADSSQE